MNAPSADEIEEAKANQGWLRLLWLTPWIVILVFLSFHIVARRSAHNQARKLWMQDRMQLMAAYAQIADAREKGFLSSPMVLADAQDALAHLQDDVHDLEGSGDHQRKQAFLEKARSCVEATPKNVIAQKPPDDPDFQLITPTAPDRLDQPPQPMDACSILIRDYSAP